MKPVSTEPIRQDLVLVGGGHSHAIALRLWAMNPLPGVRLTLITDVMHTPYSGMLPGYVAGLYRFDECHIDLQPLARFANARLVLDRAIGLDLQNNRVLCAHHPAIAFDILSLDIGSTPAASNIPGANEHAIPVKPISKFLQRWDALVEQVQQQPDQPLRIAVVGGGAGGVELSLSVQSRLQHLLQSTGRSTESLQLHLFHRGPELMPERHPSMRRKMKRLLTERGIQLHLQESVSTIEPDAVQCESGLTVPCDYTFWVTQASAAPWLEASGLKTNDRGFLLVNENLQSISHPQVFAAGDVATMVNHSRPKAGVFAVRQGKPLFDNLHHALQGHPLRPFVPQKQFLILVGLGDHTAVASRSFLTFGPTSWLWHWKDQIDRKFMQRFELGARSKELGTRKEPDSPLLTPHSLPSQMPCAGCGSKVGSSVLERSLARIQQDFPELRREDVLIGLDAPDDAAVVQVPAGQVMVQTVDYFRAIVNDPFVFGQIATHHSLSDLFAMGATPQSALAIATLPYATAAKTEETLYQLLSGAVKALHAAGASLIGGHTVEGSDLAFGLTCNGLAVGARLLRKSGMQPGDALILTKPLGTGTLFAAEMQYQAKGRWIEGAIASMLQSNQAAAQILLAHGATACTDVTGFGLLGHLAEMLRASQVSASIQLSEIPILEGAIATIRAGILSSIHASNIKAIHLVDNGSSLIDQPIVSLLVDPQTSGGLLVSVPGDRAADCVEALIVAGYRHSRVIGSVDSPLFTPTPITLIPR
ncbi:selenide, water dikinase SelD [Leptolyngbya sp. AN02str]|uniref:selenide, water dikinase SelD n=1 Tax=Leptolyngbya sp. AN02str TaxID=3423363 RepID=UPI003D30FC50